MNGARHPIGASELGGPHRRTSGTSGTGTGLEKARAIEAEVASNLTVQRLHDQRPGTVADLALPADFLQRVADRIIRDSFYERSRMCAPGVEQRAGAFAQRLNGSTDGAPDRDTIRLILAVDTPRTPKPPPPADPDGRAEEIVSMNLARKGVLYTLAELIDLLGADRVESVAGFGLLREAGFPVELLAGFSPDRAERGAGANTRAISLDGSVDWPHPVVRSMCRAHGAGGRAKTVEAVRAVGFAPAQTVPGFAAASDAGESDAGMIRFQAPIGGNVMGEEDGGPLDIIVQVARSIPNAGCIINTSQEHAVAVVRALETRAGRDVPGGQSRWTVIATPGPISQWAADHARAGTASGVRVTLAPFFADTGEERRKPAETESWAIEALGLVGERVARSPLLFQGGNMLVCSDPNRRERVMLIGEAEIHRNASRGLSREQAVEWFKVEFGVDRVLVLPAISYHIDYEVSVRVGVDGRVIAFVNDTRAAVRKILAAGWNAMARAGLCAAADAAKAIDDVNRGQARAALSFTWSIISAHAAGGVFSESFARVFSTCSGDNGVENARRFLLAMDLLTAETMQPEEFENPHFQALMRAWTRRSEDRKRMKAKLESMGWRVVAIPSLSEGNLSINTVNSLHIREKTLLPVYGGLYSQIDRDSVTKINDILGPEIKIVPIRTAQSQSREGGVRCSCAWYPE